MASDNPTRGDIERVIQDAVAGRIARRHGRRPTIAAEHTFEELGLDSLDVHELVDSLETTLQSNRFDHEYSVNDLRTVGDLYRAYLASPTGTTLSEQADETLLASRRRAAARRRSTP